MARRQLRSAGVATSLIYRNLARRRAVVWSALGLFDVASGIVALKFLELPFAWMASSWAAACVGAMAFTRRQSVKALWFNIGVALLVIAGCEIVLLNKEPKGGGTHEFAADSNEMEVDRFLPHPLFGYAPEANTRIRWKRFHGDLVLFDVWYTIDSQRLRVSPVPAGIPTDCVVFMGGSFTFGAGVNDTETLPYRVGSRAGVQAYNFGYSGYGPQQMLMLLESGVVAETISCAPTHFIYLAIEDHARRVAGKATWDQSGPRYVLAGDGTARHAGRFDRLREPLAWKWRNQLMKSRILQRVLFFDSPTRDSDLELMVSVVATTHAVTTDQFPESEFHVIFWDKRDGKVPRDLLSGLESRGETVHRVSEILPNFREEFSRFELDEGDNHPNVLAYQLLAEYVETKILAPVRRATQPEIFGPDQKWQKTN